MNLSTLLLCMTLAPSIANAGDFATCVLDKMPGVQNDAAAYAINRLCLEKYPDGLSGVAQGSGRGVFSYDSGAECAASKSAKTPSLVGGQSIYRSCNRLYSKPAPAPWESIE